MQPNSLVTPANAIELRPVDTLTPYRGNARTHSRAQIKQIAAREVARFV